MFLRGWKEIESYLKLKRRAIKRLGFPLGRAGESKSVYAFSRDLDRFLREKGGLPTEQVK